MNNQQKFVLSLLGLGGVVAIVIVALTNSGFPKPENQFSVSAEGRVFAVPNIGQIDLGVKVDNASTAEAATREGVALMNKVVEAIKDAGVEAKDIKTTSYNLSPRYNYTRDEGQELTGWNLNQNVRVKVREIDTIGEVIAAATSAGANQAGGVSFTIDDDDELKAQARAEAIDEAKQKAKELAEAAGLKLGKVINVHESQVAYPAPYLARAEAFDIGLGGGGLPTPEIQPGENEVVVNVTLVYEVK